MRAWVRVRQSSHWSLSFSPPLWYRRLRQGLARACLVTPLHDCASLLVGVPSIILLNPASPTSFRPAQAPRPTVSRVRDFWASGRARTQASHSNGPISVRVALYVLFLSASPSPPLHSPGSPPGPPRAPTGRPAARPLCNFCPQFAGRERARRTPRTVRADVTGRGAARGAREGAWPVGGYKRVAVRARPAYCGRSVGRVEVLCGSRRTSEAARSRAGPPGPR